LGGHLASATGTQWTLISRAAAGIDIFGSDTSATYVETTGPSSPAVIPVSIGGLDRKQRFTDLCCSTRIDARLKWVTGLRNSSGLTHMNRTWGTLHRAELGGSLASWSVVPHRRAGLPREKRKNAGHRTGN
jgi:hypothetical protein